MARFVGLRKRVHPCAFRLSADENQPCQAEAHSSPQPTKLGTGGDSQDGVITRIPEEGGTSGLDSIVDREAELEDEISAALAGRGKIRENDFARLLTESTTLGRRITKGRMLPLSLWCARHSMHWLHNTCIWCRLTT